MHPERSISICQIKSAVGKEGKVRRHKGIPAPALHWLAILTFRIQARLHRRPLLPDGLSLQCKLCEVFQLLIPGHIKELFLTFRDDLQTVAPSLKLAAERTHESTASVKDEDGGMILEILPAFVNDVQLLLPVDGNIMCGLPGILIR